MTDIEKIIEALRQLGSNLADPAAHVWALAIRQQIIDGLFDLFIFLILMVSLYPLVKVTQSAVKRERAKPSYSWDDSGLFIVTAVAVGSCIGIVALVFLHFGLGQLINPEWYAAKDLISLVR